MTKVDRARALSQIVCISKRRSADEFAANIYPFITTTSAAKFKRLCREFLTDGPTIAISLKKLVSGNARICRSCGDYFHHRHQHHTNTKTIDTRSMANYQAKLSWIKLLQRVRSVRNVYPTLIWG
jgi:hypothetical protein